MDTGADHPPRGEKGELERQHDPDEVRQAHLLASHAFEDREMPRARARHAGVLPVAQSDPPDPEDADAHADHESQGRLERIPRVPECGCGNEDGRPGNRALDEARYEQPAARPRDLVRCILGHRAGVPGAAPQRLPPLPVMRQRRLAHPASSTSSARSALRARVSRTPTLPSLVSWTAAISRCDSPSRCSMTAWRWASGSRRMAVMLHLEGLS